MENSDISHFPNPKQPSRNEVNAFWQSIEKLQIKEEPLASSLSVENLLKSAVPSRVMFYKAGDWEDFPRDAVLALRQCFNGGGGYAAQLTIGNDNFVVDFARMMRINTESGFLQSISWIDENGKCFFPSKAVQGRTAMPPLREQQEWINPFRLTNRVSLGFDLNIPDGDSTSEVCSVASYDETAMEDANSSITRPVKTSQNIVKNQPISGSIGGAISTEISVGFAPNYCLDGKLEEMEEGSQEYAHVMRKLLPGFGCLRNHASVAGIYRIFHSDSLGKARLHRFHTQMKAVEEVRGHASLQLACYAATSVDHVRSIISHGFGQLEVCKSTHGVGVCLSTAKHSYLSALSSKVDENDEKHILLCNVIIGNPEQVIPGTEQFQPSSENYDIGVDDLADPKQFTVWTTHANSYILPLYIVRLKASPQFQSTMASLVGKQICGASFQNVSASVRLDGPTKNEEVVIQSKTNTATDSISSDNSLNPHQINIRRPPRSPWMSFPELFKMLKNRLPSTDLTKLQKVYIEFKAGRIKRDMLIRSTRSVAGDYILAECIRSMQHRGFSRGPHPGKVE